MINLSLLLYLAVGVQRWGRFGYYSIMIYSIIKINNTIINIKYSRKRQSAGSKIFRPNFSKLFFQLHANGIHSASYRLSSCFGRQIPSPVVNLPTRFCDDRAKDVGVMANHF